MTKTALNHDRRVKIAHDFAHAAKSCATVTVENLIITVDVVGLAQTDRQSRYDRAYRAVTALWETLPA